MPGSSFCSNCGRPVESLDRFCVACGVPVAASSFTYPSTPPFPGAGAPGVPVEYAGFWRRFAASLIDSIIQGVVSYVLLNTVGPAAGAFGLVAGWLYFALMESSQLQATVGKLALGIVVTDAQGSRIGFGRATGRYFGKLLSSFTLCIGYMMAGWTARKQALHDLMADTLVVCK